MSLKKKIILGFLTSSIIIAVLVVLGFTSFIEIRKEIRYLELADNLRSKSLQVRRHEKNFLLYGELNEITSVHSNLIDLQTVLKQGMSVYRNEELVLLEGKIQEYGLKFNNIEKLFHDVQARLAHIKPLNSQYSVVFQLVESTFLERPLANAELLRKTFSLSEENPVIRNLQDLSTLMISLRKDGEEILSISNELDRSAREKVDRAIRLSQTTALILFPLFFFVGLGALFGISHSVVKRMKILSDAIERTGKGDFTFLPVPEKQDEVSVLISAFNRMETDLIARDKELLKKNEELLQSRKLASIGTLASGVAHELNNPLNNIYTTAQRLMKKTGDECSEFLKKGLDDVFEQTLRVKSIVSDLLEFARGREPQFREAELRSLVVKAYKFIGTSPDTEKIRFSLEADAEKIFVSADPELLEQVFINLFSNAVEAMSGSGNITVRMTSSDETVTISVSDTGKGISRENTEKIFEPFFTTRDKGTGLGLSIVFNIIKKHYGDIHVASEEGKGTTFTITLPKENR